MKKIILLLLTAIISVSCQKDEDTILDVRVKEVAQTTVGTHKISIQSAVNGKFYTGYNDVYLSITDTQTGEFITPDVVTFYPEMSMYHTGTTNVSHTHTCPHSQELTRNSNTYRGFSIFQMHTGSTGHWDALISYTHNGTPMQASIRIPIFEQTNKAIGNVARVRINNKMHIISVVSPKNPTIGRNDLVVGFYQMDSMTSFVPVEGYTLKLDPRMAGEEMGNHTSTNNEDLVKKSDNLYHGVVNYSMSGNWTLNFVILDENNAVVAGESIPSEEAIKACKCDYEVKSSVAIEVSF